MTYCVGIRCEQGLVMASDSRTNAGVDNVSIYSKMHRFEFPGERIVILLSAGNLATTQGVIDHMQRDLEEGREAFPGVRHLPRMADIAGYVGDISRELQARYGEQNGRKGFSAEASFLVAGQIGDQPHELLLVYPEGNYISYSSRVPFLQIGESKYGKPILDRIIRPDISLSEAARCALVSMDSTMRSNVSVGPPFELLLYRRDTLETPRHRVLDQDEPYYVRLQNEWSEALRRSFEGLPRFEWE